MNHKEQEMTSQRGKFNMEWVRKKGWYIVIGLMVLYWILKLFIRG